MSATNMSVGDRAEPAWSDASAAVEDERPDGVRVFRGILIGGAISCGMWGGIIAAVMAMV